MFDKLAQARVGSRELQDAMSDAMSVGANQHWIAPRRFGSWQVDEVEDDKKIDAVKWEPFIHNTPRDARPVLHNLKNQ